MARTNRRSVAIRNLACCIALGFVSPDDVRVCGDDTDTPAPPGMVLIPAGAFQMGNTFDEGSTDERPVHAVYVDAFYMDTYEATNQQYASALNWARAQGDLITVASGVVYKYNSGTSSPYCSTSSAPTGSPHWGEYSQITWNGSSFGVAAGKENHPVVMVSWYGAVAYANWRSAMQGRPLCYDLSDWTCNFGSGYRLPTEAEWEKAARGGVAGRRFPWADTDYIQHTRANYISIDSPYDNSSTRGFHPTFNTGVFPYTSPVGYFAPNSYGLYDMAGNVSEWCNDRYGSAYYSTTPYPHTNPHGPASGVSRVLRCGSWSGSAWWCRVAVRSSHEPDYRYNNDGFRLALNPRPGDLDFDGDVDLEDFATYTNCFAGPAVVALPPGCSAVSFSLADLDDDGDVDLADFAAFSRLFDAF